MLREGRLAAKRRTHQKGGAPNGKRQSKDEKAAGVEGYPGGFHTQAIVSGGWGTTAALAEICNPFDFWGKPPGLTPAAPMRWQSCRGAGRPIATPAETSSIRFEAFAFSGSFLALYLSCRISDYHFLPLGFFLPLRSLGG